MSAKETFYFQHDYAPTSDPKVQVLLDKYGGLGYGVFWRIIEMLHTSENHRLELKDYVLLSIAKQMLTDIKTIQSIIDYMVDPCEILMRDATSVWSTRVDRYFDWRIEISKQRAESGRKGGLARQANAKQILAKSSIE
jgi:hypothetical protein